MTGLRSSILDSPDPFAAPRREARRITAVARIPGNRRISCCAMLEVFASFRLPAVECCRGGSPSREASSRPHRIGSVAGATVSTARADRAQARHRLQPARQVADALGRRIAGLMEARA